MIAKIPTQLKKDDDIQRLFSFGELLEKKEDSEHVTFIHEQDRSRLVSDNTKRLYTVKDQDDNIATIVFDCVTKQIFYEKQCQSIEEFELESKTIVQLYDRFGNQLDNMLAIVRDLDEQEQRIYYEQGILTFRQICELQEQQKKYWFNEQNKLKNIFTQVFANLHEFFEQGFYYGNLSLDNIVFCRKENGEPGLQPKFFDLGYGTFDYQQILRQEHQQFLNNSGPPSDENERKTLELLILGQIFQDIMYNSIVEYENNKLEAFAEIGQKPYNYTDEDEMEESSSINQIMKKIREYYEPELVDALTCILMEENYEIILEKMLALNIDMDDPNLIIEDNENVQINEVIKKVQEINVTSIEELYAYLKILRNLDQWVTGARTIVNSLNKYPYKENYDLILEAFIFYKNAGWDCTPIGEAVAEFVDSLRKNKDTFFKLNIFKLFTEKNPAKYKEIYQESVDHFQLADNPPAFAEINTYLGLIMDTLNQQEQAIQFLIKAQSIYENLEEDTDEKIMGFECLARLTQSPASKLQILNQIYKIYRTQRVFQGERYAQLMENFADTHKALVQEQQQKSMTDSQMKGQMDESQEFQTKEHDYSLLSDFYSISQDGYTFIKNVIEYLLQIKPEKDKELISDMITLANVEQLDKIIDEMIIQKASLFEETNQFLEAQALLEVSYKILSKIEQSQLTQKIRDQLEILRLKHMYQETQKDFLLTEGFEKASSKDDQNYFLKRWNIELISKGDLKRALKSIINNLPNCEQNKIDASESLILIAIIYKKMEKFEKANESILQAQELIEDYNIYFLQQFVKDQISYTRFLAQEQIDNKLEFNRKQYKKMLKKRKAKRTAMIEQIKKQKENNPEIYQQQKLTKKLEKAQRKNDEKQVKALQQKTEQLQNKLQENLEPEIQSKNQQNNGALNEENKTNNNKAENVNPAPFHFITKKKQLQQKKQQEELQKQQEQEENSRTKELEDQEISMTEEQIQICQNIKEKQLNLEENQKQRNIFFILQHARMALFLNNQEFAQKILSIFLNKIDTQKTSGITVPREYIQDEYNYLKDFTNKKSTISIKQKIELIIQIDQIFFKIYYDNVTNTKEKVSLMLVNPLSFLYYSVSKEENERNFKAFVQRIGKQAKKFLPLYEFTADGQNLSKVQKETAISEETQIDFPFYQNSLLEMLQLRMKETITLFNMDPVLVQKDFIELAKKNQAQNLDFNDLEDIENYCFDHGPRGPPISYELFQNWRSNCASWANRIYAFAALNKQNLKTIYKHIGPNAIEVGAGTGYLSYLLKKNKPELNIVAQDLFPTNDKSLKNVYHGHSPSFMEVQLADVDVLKQDKYKNFDLIISYPPPKNLMAYLALKHFRGDRFIYFGEWRGVTATNQFEAYLHVNFKLVVQQAIPVFSDQACDLTIWERRPLPIEQPWPLIIETKEEFQNQEPQPIHCVVCKRNLTLRQNLYKCMFCRQNYYCSQKCLENDEDKHNNLHYIRGIFTDYDQLNIKDPQQFAETQHVRISKTVKKEVKFIIENVKKLQKIQEKQSNGQLDLEEYAAQIDSQIKKKTKKN
ncbi:hypothetical protein PPERSA_00386 [Pseudocohnilembus persalinus]|uniref:Methyltransferase small domain-containing protein n=1 Tax=Pseudocohnilembus persalinus TaxID=266149 RepID=A0A0V0QYU3_PSEPJ|nr:hypothetical protein PPERSA_00386 [Pseudocohnilembus persalinus]|eukprot:KRX07229.1 hypothetical protein PPERSA_00386 [Pseudocohnilembus persalinus]